MKAKELSPKAYARLMSQDTDYEVPKFDLEIAKAHHKYITGNSANVLDILMSINPLTGRPHSLLDTTITENLPEDVRNFLANLTLKELPPIDGAPDDETALATMQRRIGEDVNGYVQRIADFMNNERISNKTADLKQSESLSAET